MTLFVADIASWQGSLTLAQLRAVGVGAINVKVSHGLGSRTVHPNAARWIADARAAGIGVSTFHWLDASASGAEQARHAHRQIISLAGTTTGVAHVVDVESNCTEIAYRDYVAEMTRLLDREITTYSADWWWQPRGWTGRTPWLWAAPNAGYLDTYPGDMSPHWRAEYGGWDDLAVMQHAVLPVAGINVSMSAVRSMDVWTAMIGGPMPSWVVVPALEALRHEFNDAFPKRDKASDGGIGDQAHATRPSGHNPDESGVPEDYDADEINEVRSRDFDTDLRHPVVSMEHVCQYLLREVRAGRATWIKYIIFNRRIWRRSASWRQETYTGSNPHDKHLHVSCRPETAHENDTRPLGLTDFVEDMTMPSTTEIVAALRPVVRANVKTEVAELRAEVASLADDIAKAVHAYQLTNPYTGVQQSAGTLLRYAPSRTPHDITHALLADLAELMVTTDAGNDAQRAEVLARIAEVRAQLADHASTPPEDVTPPTV